MKRRTFIQSIGTAFLGLLIPFRYEDPEQFLNLNPHGKTYFVDWEKGRDTNSGLSVNKAFKTINKAMSQEFDQIMVRGS